MSARILITGGAGFIGSDLAARHVEMGDEVHLLARPTTSLSRIDRIRDRVSVHPIGLRDEAALARCFAEARPDYVYHLAVNTRRPAEPRLRDAFESIDQDLLHFLRLLRAASEAPVRPQSLIQAGTLAVYGPIEAPYTEDQRERPLTSYAAAKIAGMHYLQMLQPRLGFRTAIARLALVFGPDQSRSFLIPELIGNCLEGKPSIVRRPEDRRDLLHIDDAVDGLLHLSRHAPDGTTLVNIASGIAPTMREVAAHIVHATGADPSLIRYGGGEGEPGIRDLRASTELAQRLVGWSAHQHWTDGVDRTVAALRGPIASESVAA